ncbi:MAG: DUF1295 domain-containing protein [Ignavibacteriales bacterium]|nr:DUF1295 domain-containing protein [Ignavibacteriales bacterium]
MPKKYLILSILCMLAIPIVSDFSVSLNNPYLWMIGIIFFLTGVVFIVKGRNLLIIYGEMEKNNFSNTSSVVSRNLYSIIRHPQYFGIILILIGIICFYQNLIGFGFFIIGILLLYIQSIKEEKFCNSIFADEYEKYCKIVPRFNLFSGILKKNKL